MATQESADTTDRSSKAESVNAQQELLKTAIKAPADIDVKLREELLRALVSQSMLAHFEWLPKGIIGMSLNTHKAIANRVLDGGYKALDEYRKAALDRLRDSVLNEADPGRGTIEWYKGRLIKRDADLQQLRDEIATLSLKLDEFMSLARNMAEKSKSLEYFKAEQLRLLRKFAPKGA